MRPKPSIETCYITTICVGFMGPSKSSVTFVKAVFKACKRIGYPVTSGFTIMYRLIYYDDVTGKRRTGAIVTQLERKSRFYLVKKIASKHYNAVAEAPLKYYSPLWSCFTSLADNGVEFTDHGQIAAELNTNVYFAAPYKPPTNSA